MGFRGALPEQFPGQGDFGDLFHDSRMPAFAEGLLPDFYGEYTDLLTFAVQRV